LGNNRWGAGFDAVVLTMPGRWVMGGLVSQMWDVTNSGNDDISQMVLQPFVNYNFGHGWYMVSAPVITADWEAKGEQWTVPVGGGVGRVVRLCKQAINFRAAVYGNVIKPDQGSDYNV
jgi:roadblock/LC7 domain-containing protein